MSWLTNLGEAALYAQTVNTLGPAYYVTGEAKKDLREQGKEEEAKQIEKYENIGTVGGAIAGLTLGNGLPALYRGMQAFRTAHPVISGLVDTGLTIDGVRHALSDNGVKKTADYIKNGQWGKALGSGTIDALDLLGGVGLIGDVTNLVRKSRGVASGAGDALQYVTSTDEPFNIFEVLQKKRHDNELREAAKKVLRTGEFDDVLKGVTELPVMHDGTPYLVLKYFDNHITPRMTASRPWYDASAVKADIDLNIAGKWGMASRKIFDLAGKKKNVGGTHHPETGQITIADDSNDMVGTLIHEIRHRVDHGVPLTEAEENLLLAAFGSEFSRIPYAIKNNYDTSKDMVTTIGDARRFIFGFDDIPVHRLNTALDRMPDEVIIEALSRSNGYGNELVSLLQKEKLLTPERVQAFREAMKYVGMSALPLLLDSTYTNNYKSGGKLNYLNYFK